MSDRKQERRDIFTAHRATEDSTLVAVGGLNDGRLSRGFAEAARRIAEAEDHGYRGGLTFLPQMYLFRHAFELSMKHSVRLAVGLRRRQNDAEDVPTSEQLDHRLKLGIGHRLGMLLQELEEHRAALGLEPAERSVRNVISLLTAADPRGEHFRYAREGAPPGVLVNPVSLSKQLYDTYNLIDAAEDQLLALVEYMDEGDLIRAEAMEEMLRESQEDWLEYHQEAEDFRREAEEEMRREMLSELAYYDEQY